MRSDLYTISAGKFALADSSFLALQSFTAAMNNNSVDVLASALRTPQAEEFFGRMALLCDGLSGHCEPCSDLSSALHSRGGVLNDVMLAVLNILSVNNNSLSPLVSEWSENLSASRKA
jgi:hypothetical protein